MHLTQLQLNLRNRQARYDAGNAYEMHRTLTQAFERDSMGENPHPFLWRMDINDGYSAPSIIVVSESEGNFSALDQLHGDYLIAAPRTIAVSPIHEAGKVLRFRLTANPTRCITDKNDRIDPNTGKRKRGVRTAIHGEENQLQWLDQKAQDNGFEIQVAMVINSSQMRDIKRSDDPQNKDGRMLIQLGRVTFEGRLIVKDPVSFEQALRKGIGRGKAFGCGLLSVC